MQAFKDLESGVVPLDRSNVDTDAILPKQYMKSIARTGFGPYLFDEMRYLSPGDLTTEVSSRRKNPEFPLNQPRYEGAQILLARENFGCGSSREHAVWALLDFGIRAIIAPSFADIFHANCFKSGVLPITQSKAVVDDLFAATATAEGVRLKIDLAAQCIYRSGEPELTFAIDIQHKRNLLEGLDDIAVTLLDERAIRDFEVARKTREPWLFP